MNKQRRKRLEEASALLEQAKDILEEVKDEEAEAYENLPEGLQGSERGEAMQEAIDSLESAYDGLEVKLFAWQKTYIATGNFRQYGATTAQILRELMQVDAFPLDYSIKPTTQREAWYRGFLREIKQQLDAAGVPTREVFFTMEQKRAYMNNPENLKRERERNPEAAPTHYWKW